MKNKETGKIIFYLKGAEVVMLEKIRKKQKGLIADKC
jgi:hypothetical protein